GSIFRLKGEGEGGVSGGRPGDLYIRVRVKPHPLFKRKHLDVLGEIKINFISAILGDRLTLPYFGKELTLDIPPGTQPGDKLVLRGEGLPDWRSGRKGDLILTLQIELPKKISTEGEKLLRELAEKEGWIKENNSERNSKEKTSKRSKESFWERFVHGVKNV
ncbi:MAG: J domain-containing protein, partial [Caldimicrobium sp.]